MIHTLLVAGGIGTFIAPFTYNHYQSLTVWLVFITIFAFLLAACLKWQGRIRWVIFWIFSFIALILCIIWQIQINNDAQVIRPTAKVSAQTYSQPNISTQQQPISKPKAPPEQKKIPNKSPQQKKANNPLPAAALPPVSQMPSADESKDTPELPIEKITWVTEPISSPKEEMPFALLLTIQSNIAVSPVHFLIECSGEIGYASDFPVGGGVTMMHKSVKNGNKFEFRYEFPPLTPQRPTTVKIYSANRIEVIGVTKVE